MVHEFLEIEPMTGPNLVNYCQDLKAIDRNLGRVCCSARGNVTTEACAHCGARKAGKGKA